MIDIDMYGEPWEGWHLVAARTGRPTIVFLTHGIVGSASGYGISRYALGVAGIPSDWYHNVPPKKSIAEFVGNYCLNHGATLCQIAKAFKVHVHTQRSEVFDYGLLCDRLPR